MDNFLEFNLQYVDQNNTGHNLQVVEVFVSIENPSQLFGILDVERDLKVLLFGPGKCKKNNLLEF